MKNPWAQIPSPHKDVNVLRISDTHPLCMYWGRDLNGSYMFIYETKDPVSIDKHKLPVLEGISLFNSEYNSRHRLLMQLKDHSDWEIFYSLCMDLIRATYVLPDGSIPYHVIIRRLSRWQSFLKRKRTSLLSTEEIHGLIGELLFIKEKMSKHFGWDLCISSWKGPEEYPQDFVIHDTAIEVKCQIGASRNTIKISSAEQLLPQVPKGYIVVYTISSIDRSDVLSFSLNDLVSDLEALIENESQETRERFDALLSLVGYIPRDEYSTPVYKKLNEECFVLEKGFPRILISDIALGIEGISYRINLDSCRKHKSSPKWWR